MAIRYDKKLNNEINKTIRNFNNKITRLEKQERDLILPDKISKKELMQYTNRQDLQKRLKEIQRFSKRGAETEVEIGAGKISKYELDLLKAESRKIKSRLSKQIKQFEQMEVKVAGAGQGITLAQMNDSTYVNLKRRREALNKDIEKLDKENLKRYKNLIAKTQKSNRYYDDLFKENYIKILFNNAYMYGIDTDRLSHVKDKLMSLSSKDFLKLFNEDKLIQSILNYYPAKKNGIRDFAELYVNVSDIAELYDMLIENIDDMV